MLNYEWRLNKLLGAAKFRAREKCVDFNLTSEHLKYLWESGEGKCAITGRHFDLKSFGNKGQVNPNAPSVDRIIPKLGYTIGNVRLVTYHCNVALSDFGLDMLRQLCLDILN